MSSGQAHTTWFPELKQILIDNWKTNLEILDQFKLVADLNTTLDQIRISRNIQPPMMWCPKCKERHRSKFISISITGLFYALKRFSIVDEIEFKELNRNWKNYSKKNNIDIYGQPTDINGKRSTKA
jgi:hypothetical protein